MKKPRKRLAKRAHKGSPPFPGKPPVPTEIPQRESRHSAAARAHALSVAVAHGEAALGLLHVHMAEDERRRASEARKKERIATTFSRAGAAAWATKRAPQKQEVIRLARKVRSKREWKEAKVMEIAKELRRPPYNVKLSVEYLRHLLRAAGI